MWLILKGSGFGVTFRPAAAKALYEVWGKRENCRVLDSSAGYGARMLGAHLAGNVSFYLGIDPNTAPSCERLAKVLDERYDTGTKKVLLKMGSEDFTKENFPEYVGTFDLYFTSPPYFDTERYSTDESQSYLKFPSYAGWMTGFYRTTIHRQYT
jgi:16S rRNA G966 N2-methylase RsmD